MDFYYHNSWRMDWGFGNPNKTAAFIAGLMLAVWAIAFLWQHGFWFALLVFTALARCLVQTYSRGGLLALLAGGAVLLTWAPRPWPKARGTAALIILGITGVFILCANAETRYGQGLFSDDQSINSRLIVWKHFPEMLAAAPWGWGWGNAGDAYTQWFQPTNQSVNYLNLLSSHFTVMAEGGWICSAFYIAAWLALVLQCWPRQKDRMGAVPLAVWVGFAVGGFFSQVEDSIWLWGVPLVLLSWTLYVRFQRSEWPNSFRLGQVGLASVCVVTAVVLAGKATRVLSIKADGNAITIGQGISKTVIFVDREVMGKLYGHTLRRFWTESDVEISRKTYIITESEDYIIPPDVSQAIVSGRLVHSTQVIGGLNQCGHVILINPDCLPEESRWADSMTPQPCVYFGEYSQSPWRSSWETWPKARYHVIKGAGDFVPSWPEAIWKPAGT